MTNIFLGRPPANVETWIREHSGPAPIPTRATTIITTTEDGPQEFLIEGAIDSYWMNEHGFFDFDEFAWSKNITNVDFGVGSQEHPLTSIGASVLQDCYILSSATIGSSIIHIEAQAFYYCSNLTSIAIPDNVVSIGDQAFYYSGLRNVTLGNGMTNIGMQTFYECGYLTSVVFGNSLLSIGDSAFQGCSLPSLAIPNSVTYIGDESFTDVNSITSLTFGNNVSYIGYNAFANCTGLTSFTIPNSVTCIGSYAFSNCGGLLSVVFENWNKQTVKSKMTTSPDYIFGDAFYDSSYMLYEKTFTITCTDGSFSATFDSAGGITFTDL